MKKFVHIWTKSIIDGIIAFAAGALVLVLLFVWSFPGLHSCVWNDIAVGGGLLPPRSMLPGFGAWLSHFVFQLFSFDAGLTVNVVLAKLIAATSAGLAFGSFAGGMELISGTGARDLRRRTIAIRLSAFVAAVAFACSEPMWHAAQGLSASTVVVFLAVLTLNQLVRFLRTASLTSVVVALCASGLLCAETPLGWLLFALAVPVSIRHLTLVQDETWKAFLDPVALQRTKWTMTFVFIAAFLVGGVLEMLAFADLGGMKAAGLGLEGLPLAYLTAYGDFFVSSMNVNGLILLVLAVLVPFAISAMLVVPSTDEDRYLPLKFSIVFLMAAAIAFLQLSPFDAFWFWKAVPGVVVSQPVLVVASLMSALTLAMGLLVLGVEVLCRNYSHIETMMYQLFDDERPDAEGATDDVESVRPSFIRLAALVVPVLVLVVAVAGRRLVDDRSLLGIVLDGVRETVDEAKGTKYLFTDGSLDDAVRIEARRRGVDLRPISLASDDSPYEIAVRRQALATLEDRLAFGSGAAAALRNWIDTQPERLPEIALQLAFEQFSAEAMLSLSAYGLLARPVGDPKAAASSVDRAIVLSERLIAMHENGGWDRVKDDELQNIALLLQFRLAVLARLRSAGLDSRGEAAAARDAVELAERLNAANPALCEVLSRQDWVRRQAGNDLTPREELEIALRRADFPMARRYALPILKDSPQDPDANFAMGMSYYVEEQLSRAETYLRSVLKARPDDAAVCNNLALICLRTNRLAEAERLAKKATELSPDSAAVKDTLRQVEQAVSGQGKSLEKEGV